MMRVDKYKYSKRIAFTVFFLCHTRLKYDHLETANIHFQCLSPLGYQDRCTMHLPAVIVVFIDISPNWGLFDMIKQICHASVGILMECLSLWETFYQDTHTGMAYLYIIIPHLKIVADLTVANHHVHLTALWPRLSSRSRVLVTPHMHVRPACWVTSLFVTSSLHMQIARQIHKKHGGRTATAQHGILD